MSTVTSRPPLDLAQVEFHADTIDIDRAVRSYHEFGLFIVRGLLRPYVDRLRLETEQAVQCAREELPQATQTRYGWLTPSGAIFTDRRSDGTAIPGRRHLIVLPMGLGSSRAMRACAEDARLFQILHGLLNEGIVTLGNGQCMFKEARGGNETGLHQDAIYPGMEDYCDVVTTFTYVVPTSIERGCIWLVPYSHRMGLLPHEESGQRVGCLRSGVCDWNDAIPIPGDAGDTLFWNWTVIHGSKENQTDLSRPAIAVRYGHMKAGAARPG